MHNTLKSGEGIVAINIENISISTAKDMVYCFNECKTILQNHRQCKTDKKVKQIFLSDTLLERITKLLFACTRDVQKELSQFTSEADKIDIDLLLKDDNENE